MVQMQDPRDQASADAKAFAAKENKAKADNLAREKEIRGIYDSIISRYEPGGAFEQSQLQQLGVQRAQGVGQATQNLVSSGLFNTTKAAGVGNAWERDVGTPARMRLEDIMTTRRNEAQGEKAGFIERISNAYPSTDPLMAAANAQGFADQYGAAGGGGGGGSYSGGMRGFESLTPGYDPVLAYTGPPGGSGQTLGAIGQGFNAFGYTPPSGVDLSAGEDNAPSRYEDSAYAAVKSNVKAAPAKVKTTNSTPQDNMSYYAGGQQVQVGAYKTPAQKTAEAQKMVEMEKNRYITPQKAAPSVGPTVQNAAALAAQKAAAQKKTSTTISPQYGSTAKYSQYQAY